MRARSPNAAVDALLARHRRVAACITDRLLVATGSRPSAEAQSISFVPGAALVPLRTVHGVGGPALWIRHRYTVSPLADRRAYEVRTVGYRYHVHDARGREVLAFHWHPVGRSPITDPHVHVSGSFGPVEIDLGEPTSLSDMHLPTGPIAFADVVRLLINEFGVAPRRPDWAAVLRANRDVPRIDAEG